MKHKVIFAVITGLLMSSTMAHARTNINLINGTSKALAFVVSEPDGSTSTDQYKVEANSNYSFTLDDVITRGCEHHGLCHKSKLWVVLEKWGDGIVYLRCPKMSKDTGRQVNLKITGDDSSTLVCDFSKA